MNDKRLAELKAIAAKKGEESIIHIKLGMTVMCGARAEAMLCHGVKAYHSLRERGIFKCCQSCLELYEALSEKERLIIECP